VTLAQSQISRLKDVQIASFVKARIPCPPDHSLASSGLAGGQTYDLSGFRRASQVLTPGSTVFSILYGGFVARLSGVQTIRP